MTITEQKQPYVHMTLPLLRRARELYGVGLSCEAVRRVLELDFGTSPSATTIRFYVGQDGRRPHLASLARGSRTYGGAL